MSEADLRAAIKGIRAELAKAEGLSEASRSALRQLADDLEAIAKRPRPEPNDTLRTELGDWVRELEASHPKLSSTIGSVIDTLAFFNL